MSDMAIQPKICPFCGSPSFLIGRSHDRKGSFHFVRCGDCKAEGPPAFEQSSDVVGQTAAMEQAMVQWNRRHVFL